MLKWIIIMVVIAIANMGIRPSLNDTHQLVISDNLAVAQLEDSDVNRIAMKADSRSYELIDFAFFGGSVLLIGLGIYSDRKKIKTVFD